MESLNQFIIPLLDLLKANYMKVVAAAATLFILYVTFSTTAMSLRKLKTDIFSSYPFEVFFPRSGEWSVGYFLIVILFLGLLIYFLEKGNFYFGPA